MAAAARHFPACAKAIEGRAKRDKSFREICMALPDAKAELAKWEASTDQRDERRSVYEELVAALSKEIENALDDGMDPAVIRRKPWLLRMQSISSRWQQ